MKGFTKAGTEFESQNWAASYIYEIFLLDFQTLLDCSHTKYNLSDPVSGHILVKNLPGISRRRRCRTFKYYYQ
ncbi:MAG: hypothetical protein ABI543_06280 [Ignavibacteria bacterium]